MVHTGFAVMCTMCPYNVVDRNKTNGALLSGRHIDILYCTKEIPLKTFVFFEDLT
jgi:hypothetical protein